MVQAQRLLRILCHNCRKPRRLSQHEQEIAIKHLPSVGNETPEFQAFISEWNEILEHASNGVTPIYDPTGCLHCNQILGSPVIFK